MAWLFRQPGTGLDQAVSTLNPFVAAALSGVEVQVLREQVRVRTLAECYVYGAIRYLASYDGMRAGSAASLLDNILTAHFGADQDEIISYRSYIERAGEGGSEQLFMIEGASALRRWLVEGDRTAGSDLKRLLGTLDG